MTEHRSSRKHPGTPEQIDTWLEYGLHVPTSTITIFGDIDDKMAYDTIRRLHLLPDTRPIHVLLDTTGGLETAGLAIYDALVCRKVSITVVGQALSMGAIILQAGRTRRVMPHASIMIHTGSKEYEGKAEDVRREIQHGKRLDDICDDILLRRMQVQDKSLTLGKLRDIMGTDTYYLGDEIVEIGLADEVADV